MVPPGSEVKRNKGPRIAAFRHDRRLKRRWGLSTGDYVQGLTHNSAFIEQWPGGYYRNVTTPRQQQHAIATVPVDCRHRRLLPIPSPLGRANFYGFVRRSTDI